MAQIVISISRAARAARAAVPILAVALLTCGAPGGAADTTPAQAYNETLNVMAALPQPADINFTASVMIRGAGIRMNRDKGVGGLQIGAGRSFKPTDSWAASFRTADGSAVVHATDGATLRVRSPLFKPTWKTATIWARYGFRGQAEATPAPVATTPEPAAADGTQVIGRIQSLASSGYRIEDGAPEQCANNARPTRHLHFTPLLAAATHPLTDIVIDDESKRVCEMRFRVATVSSLTVTGYVRIDFGERGAYWMVTGGGGDYVLRFFGIGVKHAAMNFAILNPTFD
jgi:hypothetical protein